MTTRQANPLRLLAVLVPLLLGYAALVQTLKLAAAGGFVHADFFGLWSFARFAGMHGVASLYRQPAALAAFQQHLGLVGHYPYPYPPVALLWFWPLGGLGLNTARLIWTLLTAAACALAVAALLGPGRGWRAFGILFVVLSPAAGLNLADGETGYLIAALLLGGFALLPRTPIAAGILFGLLLFKPQFGWLLPFALAGLGAWRAFAIAALCGVGQVALSALLFTPDSWHAWGLALSGYQAQLTANGASLYRLMSTLDATARTLGLGWSWAAQGLLMLAVAGLVWLMFHRTAYRLAVAAFCALLPAACLHGFDYDMVFFAIAPLLAAESGLAPLWSPRTLLWLPAYIWPYVAGSGRVPWNLAAIFCLFYGLYLVRRGLTPSCA